MGEKHIKEMNAWYTIQGTIQSNTADVAVFYWEATHVNTKHTDEYWKIVSNAFLEVTEQH